MATAPLRLAALALVLVGCTSKVGPTGDRLIPAEASLLVGFDVGRTLGSETFGLLRPAMADDPKFERGLAGLKECGVDPVAHHLALTIGSDGKDEAVVVATGDDLGDLTKLRCVADKLADHGTPAFAIGRPDAPAPADAEAIATVVDRRTVVFASRAWNGLAADRIANRGVAAIDGPLAAQYGRVDRTAHLWIAGRVPDKTANELQATLGAKVGEVVATVDVAQGLRVDIAVGLPSIAQAAALQKTASEGLAGAKAALPMIGIGAKTVESIRFEAVGSEFRFGFVSTLEDIRSMVERLAPMAAMARPSEPDERDQAAAQMLLLVEDSYTVFRRGKPEACPEHAELKAAGLLTEWPMDPWGRRIEVVCPGKHGPIDVFSWGADGQPGTADDVRNWD